jgi:hypothetical protein
MPLCHHDHDHCDKDALCSFHNLPFCSGEHFSVHPFIRRKGRNPSKKKRERAMF